MFIASEDKYKDYTNATAVDIFMDIELPSDLFTNQCVVSTNEPVIFSVELSSYDFSVDVFFDDGNGNVLELSAQYLDPVEIPVYYDTEGIFSPSLSTRRLVNPDIVQITNYTNLVCVKNDNTVYDKLSDRQIFSELVLPFSKKEMEIPPSSFVKASVFNEAVDKFWANLNYLMSQLTMFSQDLPILLKDWYDGTEWKLGMPDAGSLSAKDIAGVGDYILTLEGDSIVTRRNDKYLTVVEQSNQITEAEIFFNPMSMSIYNGYLLVVDSERNGFYVFHFDGVDRTLEVFLGGYGTVEDNYRFNSPSNGIITNDGVLIADTGNRCLKQYNSTFHWEMTYSNLEGTKPLKITRNNNEIFVLCDDDVIRVFPAGTDIVSRRIKGVVASPKNIILDDFNQDLLYIFGDSSIALLNSEDKIISINYAMPTIYNIWQNDKTFIGLGGSYLIRFVDYLTFDSLVSGPISSQMFGLDELYVDWREYDQHLIYNDSFAKMRANLSLLINSVTAVPVNYYDFDGNFIYQIKEDRPEASCDFSDTPGIGFNEIESYDVMHREWGRLWDQMDCVRTNIETIKKHPTFDETACLRWSSGKKTFDYNNKTMSWPISWEELDCDESSIAGTIRGILPQHWTWAWLQCERPNAPTFADLTCEVIPDNMIKTWEEMEHNDAYPEQYTWKNTSKTENLETFYQELTCHDIWGGLTWSMICNAPVENPYPISWKNLDCCDTTYNVLPYDFFNADKNAPVFSWKSLECSAAP